MRLHLTRAATFEPFRQFLEAGGSSVSRRLSGIGIAPDLLDSPENLIPFRRCCHFVDRSMSRDGIEDLGMEVGSRASIGDFGLFGMVLRQSLTLKDLIGKLIAWMPMVDSAARAWLEEVDGADAVRLCIEHDVDVARSQVDDYGMMLLIDAVRIAAGSTWRPSAVWLDRCQSGKGVSRFEALSETSVHHRSKGAGFLIPRRLLSKRVRRGASPKNPAGHSERSLRSTAPPVDLIGSVTCAIRTGMKSRAPSLEEVADMAGTNQRAMQRRLRSRGTSFRELLDRVRFEEATQSLRDKSLQISEIAYHLGYTELSNFSHAFLRSGRDLPERIPPNEIDTVN